MRLRALLFLVLAVVLASGTAYLARTWLSETRQQMVQETRQQQSPKAYVLVAAKDLPAGTLMHAEDLRWQSWPDDQLNDAYLRQDKDDAGIFTGAVVRLHIAKGEPVTAGRVVKPGERGFLAAVLAPGMRAISVPLTATSDVAGLILPGDRVDLILSHQIKNEREPNAPARQASETVLTNLRVVAIDQVVNDQDKKPIAGKTATFEVTPKQAEIVEVAKALGNLSLVLRSAGRTRDEDEAASRPDGAGEGAGGGAGDGAGSVSHTWDSDVSPLIHHREPTAQAALAVTILRGDTAKAAAGATRIIIPAEDPGAASGASPMPRAPRSPGIAMSQGAMAVSGTPPIGGP